MTQIKYNSLDRSRIQQLPNEVHRKEPEQGSAIAKGLADQGMAEQCMLVKWCVRVNGHEQRFPANFAVMRPKELRVFPLSFLVRPFLSR